MTYLRTKWHLDLSSRLATIHEPKVGAAIPLFGERGWVPTPHLTQCRFGRGLPPDQVAS